MVIGCRNEGQRHLIWLVGVLYASIGSQQGAYVFVAAGKIDFSMGEEIVSGGGSGCAWGGRAKGRQHRRWNYQRSPTPLLGEASL